MLKKICHLLLITLLVSSCAQQPDLVTLELPKTPYAGTAPNPDAATVRLESQDLRTASYVVVILGDSEPAELYGAGQNLRQLIADTLSERWQQQGVTIDPRATPRLRIELVQLLAEVEQGTLSHQINSNIRIKMDYADGNTSFSKLFRSTATREGVFKVKLDKVQQQLSEQLASVLDDIINDEQLRQQLGLHP